MLFPVDLHSHTIASDHAYSTLGEYVSFAKERGIEMFATTDHGPALPDAPHMWHFGNLKVVPRVIDDVAILRGIEANITIDGDIDLEEYVRKTLDIVLCGFHPCIDPQGVEENTRLLVSVIKSGKVDVITHPGSPNYPINLEEFLVTAKEYNVAIEINSSSDVSTRRGSFSNCVQIAKLAKKIGNTIALGSDAHICYFLGNFEQSMKVIEQAEISYDQILNTSAIKVLDFLSSRGKSNLEELYNRFTI